MSNSLFIWVEGGDDEEFINRIIKPQLENRYNNIKIIQYSKEKLEWRFKFIKSIQSMNSDYIYLADLDLFPCISSKKTEIQQQIANLDQNKVIIVKPKIEGWYYAGLDRTAFEMIGIKDYDKIKKTDHLTKDDFSKSCPKKYQNNDDKFNINFKQEILRNYNLEYVLQQQTNQSLVYFIKKYCL